MRLRFRVPCRALGAYYAEFLNGLLSLAAFVGAGPHAGLLLSLRALLARKLG